MLDATRRMNATQLEGDHAPTAQKSQPKALRFVTNYGAPHPKRYTEFRLPVLLDACIADVHVTTDVA